MVWGITIATFLGTVVAVLLIFFIFSRREQIRDALREQRTEKRVLAKVDLELCSLDERIIYEKAFTENASLFGARVVALKPWQPNDYVLVRLLPGNERSRARIAYCSALPGNAFAIGLQFSSVIFDWVISRSESSNDKLSGHPYRK